MSKILDTKLYGQLKGLTLRTFFRDCMIALIEEGESFSGKRPICDSGWESDIAISLIDEGLMSGKIVRNKDGDIDELDYEYEELNSVIKKALTEWIPN